MNINNKIIIRYAGYTLGLGTRRICLSEEVEQSRGYIGIYTLYRVYACHIGRGYHGGSVCTNTSKTIDATIYIRGYKSI